MEMVQKKASLSPWGPADTVSLSKEPPLAALQAFKALLNKIFTLFWGFHFYFTAFAGKAP